MVHFLSARASLSRLCKPRQWPKAEKNEKLRYILGFARMWVILEDIGRFLLEFIRLHLVLLKHTAFALCCNLCNDEGGNVTSSRFTIRLGTKHILALIRALAFAIEPIGNYRNQQITLGPNLNRLK